MIFDEPLYRGLRTPGGEWLRIVELEKLLRTIQQHDLARLAVLPDDPTRTVAEIIEKTLNYQSDFWEK